MQQQRLKQIGRLADQELLHRFNSANYSNKSTIE
jgi:hypothetical protein